ncbi:type II toxin-antitoxin system VapB family antitoxin [Stutzerimonas stutzeri]|uniref:type II toxin-antitoxin system VapB family antitoxin n=1 Tax=Stutzerimonas stutzeri TaxID=316 RepID=UPI002109000E|nr:type II toxin-antitoxin system VapB family antitoxin [Stutzerimonas stutzeri]MCQ4320751.1 type II toxin-antitoxin system VapB family antitoxin [Stutzerimonas stutzeri]
MVDAKKYNARVTGGIGAPAENPSRLTRFDVYLYCHLYTLALSMRLKTMRTNIEIDDNLMDDALKATGLKTKREAVELGLKTLIKLKKQEGIKRFRGKLEWTGDLDDMRYTQ